MSDESAPHDKTVFILISRSFLTRNILRSGTLALLKAQGYRICIFFQATEVPSSLEQEFGGPRVFLHAYSAPPPHPLHRRFNKLKRYLLDTRTVHLGIRFGVSDYAEQSAGPSLIQRVLWHPSMHLAVLLLSHLTIVHRLFRVIERRVFPQRFSDIEAYFSRYVPAVVLSTSLISGFDVLFLKEACRRRVPTISMPKGWDNVTKEFYPFQPDWFASPNDTSSKLAEELQEMPPTRIRTVGMPQFDWYVRPEIRNDRSEHLRSKGLDPTRKTVFFGSEGLWSRTDVRIAHLLYEWVLQDALGCPAQLRIRPHYSEVQSSKFDDFRGKPLVRIDDYPRVDFMADKWDPTETETVEFVRSIVHADVVVNIASSLSLDAACADRPAILVGFGCEYEGNTDVTLPKLYGSDHMQWLAESGGVPRADSEEELKHMIMRALADPAWLAEGRARLRSGLCFRVDGKSSERLASLVTEVIKSGR